MNTHLHVMITACGFTPLLDWINCTKSKINLDSGSEPLHGGVSMSVTVASDPFSCYKIKKMFPVVI